MTDNDKKYPETLEELQTALRKLLADNQPILFGRVLADGIAELLPPNPIEVGDIVQLKGTNFSPRTVTAVGNTSVLAELHGKEVRWLLSTIELVRRGKTVYPYRPFTPNPEMFVPTE